MINFPFVLMDTKYRLEKPTALNASSSYTPFSSAPIHTNSVDASYTELPIPSSSQSTLQDTNQFTVAPLRIHQWKQQ